MRRSLLGGVAVFCLALLVAGGALVAERDTQWAALQLDPEWSQFRSYVTQQDLGYHNDAWQAFEAANPGEWKTEWDMRTGFPHVVYGPGLDTGYSAMDAGTAASVAFDLIEEHGPLFGVESFDLDMSTGVLTLNFPEVVTADNVTFTGIVLQAAADTTASAAVIVACESSMSFGTS